MLIALASVAHAVAYLVAAPEHAVDLDWPLHARFHVVQALIWVVGLDLVLALVALGPLRRGAALSLPALGLGGLVAHGAYFIAMAVVPDGRPPELSSHLILGGIMAVYALGFGLAMRAERNVSVPPRR